MVKLLRYLFPLYVLLVSGYFQHHGDTLYKSISSSVVKNNQYLLVIEKKQRSVCKPVLSNKEDNQHNRITDIEEKKNEIISFKKYSAFSNNIHPLSRTQIAEYFFQYTPIYLFFIKQFFYYPSCKSLYLIFEVIRI